MVYYSKHVAGLSCQEALLHNGDGQQTLYISHVSAAVAAAIKA